MLRSALGEVKGVLDSRFLLTFLFPCLMFWALVLLVWELGLRPYEETVRAWEAEPEALKVVQVVGFLAVVTVSALLLASSMNTLLRVYEGYWVFPFEYLLRPLRRRHERRLAELAKGMMDPANYEELYLSYPPPTRRGQVRPTLFGNVLKNAESYPEVRYGIDTVLIWSRLYHLLPKTLVANLSAARAGIEQMIVVSALGLVFAVFSGIDIYWTSSAGWLHFPGWAWWGCVLGGLFVFWVAYRGAVGHARIYGTHLKAAFDLHRNDFLKLFRLPLPANLDEERARWIEVCKFLYKNAPDEREKWVYLPQEEPGEEKVEAKENGEKADNGKEAEEEEEGAED
jgi:hypothetical protein